jgi:hypothetical protein
MIMQAPARASISAVDITKFLGVAHVGWIFCPMEAAEAAVLDLEPISFPCSSYEPAVFVRDAA